MLWFKDNKGLGTGLAVAGFGLAKMVYSPIMFKLQQSIGLWQMFVILAAVFLVTMTLGMVLIKKPDDWIEEPLVNKFQPVALLKNRSFIGIWLMFYLNITCGLAVISQEKDIMGSLVNGNGITIFSATAITTVVSVDAFFNAAGRIGFATLSDHLRDRNTVYKIIFVLSAALALATFFMPSTAAWLAIVLVMTFFTINAGYGGGFSALPPLLSDRFGMKAISKIHGLALSAWAIAGLSGNQLASFITNGLHLQYQSMFIVIAILYVVALGIAYVMVKPQQTLVY
jgi:OFA family oxalate/formate antiporter-like MFS transporter